MTLTPSGRPPRGRLITADAGERRPVGPEVRRQVLAPLFRTLVQRREPSTEAMRSVLQLTTERLQAAFGARGAFLLIVDPTVNEAEIVGACLGSPEEGEGQDEAENEAQRKRRLARAEALQGAKVRTNQLGFLRGLRGAVRRDDDLEEGEVPLALTHAMRCDALPALAVPVTLSQRLNAVCALLGGRLPFSKPEQALVEEATTHLCRGLQRSLGLGSPLSSEEKARYVAVLADVEFWEPPEGFQPDEKLLDALGGKRLARAGVLPLERLASGGLRVAVANPLDLQAIEDFELAVRAQVQIKLASTAKRIRDELRRVYPSLEAIDESGEAAQGDMVAQLAHGLRDFADDSPFDWRVEEITEDSSPIVRMACHMIEDAYFRGASDIHVEVGEHRVVIRHRIDGTCRERVALPVGTARPLVARLKIMSDLDVAEHRLPQDGRIDYRRFNADLPIDLRVSVLPMLHGEWVCLRVLEKKRSSLPLDELGFSDYSLERYRQAIRTPYGLILHCGPTGAGKSMTLYAALNEINDERLKIMTAEDPIEYVLRGIGQLQIKRGIGLTFSSALRSFLRHDPDVILVGEIRDEETARMAVDASLTGHLLLSTLHTNDAASSVLRLTKLGIEPFLVANTLVCVVAQRLIRRLCHCHKLVDPTTQERAYLKRAKDDLPVGQVAKAVGCERCNHLGYRGRTGVHELLTLDSRLRQQISEGSRADVLKRTARDFGMRTLFEDCLAKVKSQTTTLEEAFRVAQPDEAL